MGYWSRKDLKLDLWVGLWNTTLKIGKMGKLLQTRDPMGN